MEIRGGDLYFCLKRRFVSVCEQVIDLTAKAFDMLTLLISNHRRLGREYSYMGRLQGFILQACDVRFIAFNDDVDSAKGENEIAVFRNVFNDYYAKDTSRKIRAVVKLRSEAGKRIASNPPYGYVKDTPRSNGWRTRKRRLWRSASSPCASRAKVPCRSPDS